MGTIIDAFRGFNGVRLSTTDLDDDDSSVGITAEVTADEGGVVVASEIKVARVGQTSGWTIEFPVGDPRAGGVGLVFTEQVLPQVINLYCADPSHWCRSRSVPV